MFRMLFLAVASALLPACSTYHADFAKAVQAAPMPPDSPTGPWKGRWKSNHNGHEGPLWCVIKAGDAGPYDFRYRAGWAKIQFGDYTHTCPVKKQEDGSLRLDSAMKLPGDWGTYTITGTITNTVFDATYKADTGDHGTVKLRRP